MVRIFGVQVKKARKPKKKEEKKPVKKQVKGQKSRMMPEPALLPITDDEVRKRDDTLYYPAHPMHLNFNLSRKKAKEQRKFMKRYEGEVVLIRMEMGTGQFREFLAHDEGGFFFFRRKEYILDSAMKYYIIERSIWGYDFHEFISIPIRKKFDLTDDVYTVMQPIVDAMQQEADRKAKKPLDVYIDEGKIKTLIENAQIVDVEASLNPLTLKRFTESEVIKQVLQGTMLGKIFKIMFVLIIILAVFGLIQLILSVYQSGIIEKLIGQFNG